jgi:hypothetical protein
LEDIITRDSKDYKYIAILPEDSRSLIIGFQIEYKLIAISLPSPFFTFFIERGSRGGILYIIGLNSTSFSFPVFLLTLLHYDF